MRHLARHMHSNSLPPTHAPAPNALRRTFHLQYFHQQRHESVCHDIENREMCGGRRFGLWLCMAVGERCQWHGRRRVRIGADGWRLAGTGWRAVRSQRHGRWIGWKRGQADAGDRVLWPVFGLLGRVQRLAGHRQHIRWLLAWKRRCRIVVRWIHCNWKTSRKSGISLRAGLSDY